MTNVMINTSGYTLSLADPNIVKSPYSAKKMHVCEVVEESIRSKTLGMVKMEPQVPCEFSHSKLNQHVVSSSHDR